MSSLRAGRAAFDAFVPLRSMAPELRNPPCDNSASGREPAFRTPFTVTPAPIVIWSNVNTEIPFDTTPAIVEESVLVNTGGVEAVLMLTVPAVVNGFGPREAKSLGLSASAFAVVIPVESNRHAATVAIEE